MVDKVLAENPKQLEQYRGGKTKLQGYFAGQVKNKTKLCDLIRNLFSIFSLGYVVNIFPLYFIKMILYILAYAGNESIKR